MEENSPTTQQQQPTSFLAKLTSYITSVPLVGGGAGGGNNGGNNNNNNTSSKLNKNTPHQNNLEVNSMGGEYYSKSNSERSKTPTKNYQSKTLKPSTSSSNSNNNSQQQQQMKNENRKSLPNNNNATTTTNNNNNSPLSNSPLSSSTITSKSSSNSLLEAPKTVHRKFSSSQNNQSPLDSSLKPVTDYMGDGEETHATRNSGKNSSGSLFDDSIYITKSKLEKFEELLIHSEDPDLDKIKKISWSGIPSIYRSLTWKLLLGYLPCNSSLREQTLKRKRKEYLELVSKYYDEKAMKKTDYEIGIQRQIHIDVPRTNPDVILFQNQKIQDALERVLYIWSIRHPASGYVQGINDIVTPFLTVFLHDSIGGDVLNMKDLSHIDEETLTNVECDSFWCFSSFLDFIQDHYTFSQPGIRRMVQKLEEIIQKIDEPLYKHIKEQNLLFIQFAFRWMNCLLMRELSLKLIVRMFDAFLAEGEKFESLHVYVCASFLNTWSEKLMKLDFTEMVIFIQHLPTQEWTYKEIEMLLSQAYMLKTLYDDTKTSNK